MALRVAIYARVSTDDQDCHRQVRELGAWAERLAWDVVSVQTEKASGSKDDRPSRAVLIDLARRGEIDSILVLELSRWSRSIIDLLSTLNELASYGVSVKALNGVQMDISTPHGKLIAGVLALIAEFQRDLINQNVRSGLAAARARGVRLGRQAGDCPAIQKHAKKVRELRSQGLSIRRIADRVNCSPTTVQKILKSNV